MGLSANKPAYGGPGQGVRLNAPPICTRCGCRCPIHGLNANNENVCLDCMERRVCVDHSCCGQAFIEVDE